MLTDQFILQSLQALENAYNAATTADEAERCSKLAIIEMCGWIEESMDSVIIECRDRHLKDATNIELCEKEIIEKTYGFEYDKNFRSMLMRLVGLIAVEVLEKKVDQVKLDAMKSTLRSLKTVRNSVAHTHLKGVTRSLDAPSVTRRNFQCVAEGLVEIEKTMINSGL